MRSRARTINNNGAMVGTATYSGTNYPTGSHGVMLCPMSLVNLADPYAGTSKTDSHGNVTVINPSHNSQDTPIAISTSTNNPDINAVAWIAAHDPTNSNAPRMPKLEAKIAAPSGCQVWWKLQMIFHDRFGNPHRDFDTGPVQDTSVAADTVTVPDPANPTHRGDETADGWVRLTDGSTWDIYDDTDWTRATSQGFFGGDATLSVKIMSSDGTTTILPQSDWHFRIAGENPDPVKCKAFIMSQTSSLWWAYAIAKHETKYGGGRTYYNQFSDNGGKYSKPISGKEGKPYWNNDGSTTSPVSGSGGYGLFQLTFDSTDPNFVMPRGWIWNWQQNVQQGLSDVQSKLTRATSYVNNQRTSAGGVPVPKHSTSREPNPDSGDDVNPHVPPAGQPMTMIGGDNVYGYPAGATVSFYDTSNKPAGQGELIEVAQSIKAYNGLSGGSYVRWNGTAWKFNRARSIPADNKSYVDLISIEIEAPESHAVSP